MVHQQTDQVFDAQSVPVERVCQYGGYSASDVAHPEISHDLNVPDGTWLPNGSNTLGNLNVLDRAQRAEKSSSRLYSQNIDKQQCREDHLSFQASKLLFVSVAHCEKYRHFT